MVRRVFLAALLTIVPPTGTAQEPPPADAAFGERLAVDLVEVEVFVADRKGRPVEGLEAGDFALEVDGRPVEIAAFSSPAERRRAAAASSSGARAAEAAGSEDLHLVFYVDAENLSPHRRQAFAEAAAGFLARDLPAGARAMVVVQDHGLRVVQPFTADAAAVAGTLERLPSLAGTDRERRVEEVSAYESIRGIRASLPPPDFDFCSDGWEGAQAVALSYAHSVAETAARSLDGLGRVAGALAGLEGRKTLVYVGDGLERRPGIDLYHYLDELCRGRGSSGRAGQPLDKAPAIDLTRAFQDLTARANAAGVTLYALQTLDLANAVAGSGSPGFITSAEVGRLRLANLQSGLVGITEETGGRALFDTSRFAESLARITGELDDAYVVAFVPPGPPDGRDHWIEIAVADRDAETVRHRTVYRAKPLEERIEEQLYGSLLFGTEANPLSASLAFGASTAADEPAKVRLPVEIRVPLDALTLVRAPDGASTGELRLVMTARDAEARWLPARQKRVPLRLAPGGEAAAVGTDGAVHRFVVDLDLPPGEHLVAVAVRDETSGEVSYLRADVEASPAAAAPDPGAAADGRSG